MTDVGHGADFHEDDEPVDEIVAAFEAGQKGSPSTAARAHAGRSWSSARPPPTGMAGQGMRRVVGQLAEAGAFVGGGDGAAGGAGGRRDDDLVHRPRRLPVRAWASGVAWCSATARS